MGGGAGGGGFNGTRGSTIRISEKKMHQVGKHFNKHGREMGFKSITEYDNAAKTFAREAQLNPNSEIYQGRWTGRGMYHDKVQRIITYDGNTVIIDPHTGQIIDFYRGSDYRGIIDIEQLR